MLIFERVEIFNHIHKKPCFSYVILKNTKYCTVHRKHVSFAFTAPCALYMRSICGSNESICLVCFSLLCPFKAQTRVVNIPYPPVIKKSVSAATQTRLSQAHKYPISNKTKLPFICRLFAVYFYNKQQVFTTVYKE